MAEQFAPVLMPRDVERFLAKVALPGDGSIEAMQVSAALDQCWVWTGGRAGGGRRGSSDRADRYGVYSVHLDGRKQQVGAHRIMRFLAVGPFPADLVVMHSCDTRFCVAPHHVTDDTQAANRADMVTKGRHALGIDFRHSKLTARKAADARRRGRNGETLREIVIALGGHVTTTAIRRIWARRAYKYVTDAALKIACPTCHATVDALCDASVGVLLPGYVHPARHEIAETDGSYDRIDSALAEAAITSAAVQARVCSPARSADDGGHSSSGGAA